MTETSRWDAVGIVVLHIVAGPPIGGLAALAAVLSLDAGVTRAGDVIAIVPLALVASYFIGIVPAAVTGAWAALRLRQRGCYGAIEAAGIGALSGATYLLALPWIAGRVHMAPGQLVVLVLMGLAGMLSALACRRLMAVLGYLDRPPALQAWRQN